MEKKTRKYYRVTIKRVPPYYPINNCYEYEEDVFAFSKEGALNKIKEEYSKRYGKHIPKEINEITKDDFRGDKKRS